MLDREVVERLGEMLAKATPGPWRCTDGPVGYQHRVSSDDSDGETVCDVERTSADAALIAAAVNALPELLRVYRAWLDAPVVEIDADADEHVTLIANGSWLDNAITGARIVDMHGQRARLVRDGDSGEG